MCDKCILLIACLLFNVLGKDKESNYPSLIKGSGISCVVRTSQRTTEFFSTLQDAVGRVVSFGYSSGLLTNIQDWAGRRTTFQYDTASASPKNLLTTITGPTGCQTQYQYATFAVYSGTTLTSDWMLSGIVDPNGYGTSYTYDR